MITKPISISFVFYVASTASYFSVSENDPFLPNKYLRQNRKVFYKFSIKIWYFDDTLIKDFLILKACDLLILFLQGKIDFDFWCVSILAPFFALGLKKKAVFKGFLEQFFSEHLNNQCVWSHRNQICEKLFPMWIKQKNGIVDRIFHIL